MNIDDETTQTLLRQEALEREFGHGLPLPLRRKTDAPKAFPFDALGPILGSAAKRMHEVIQAPDAICGQSVLAAAAYACQAFADVHIDGRAHPLSLFLLSVAESGDRKSACDQIAVKPIYDFQRILVAHYAQAKLDYNLKKDLWNQKRKELLQKQDNIQDLENEPEPPLEPFCLLEEPSYESLIGLFAIGQPSLGLFSDEGGRMLTGYSMEPSQMVKTACGLSSLWDGGKPITRSRVGEGNFILYGRRLSMHLMIQEVILNQLLANDMLKGQGFLARFLVCMPPSTAGHRPYQSIDLSKDETIQAYWKHLQCILSQPCPLKNQQLKNELQPRQLFLNTETKKYWISFHDSIDSQLKEGGNLRLIKRTASKSAEQAVRIAGILSYVENQKTEHISLENMCNAVTLIEYFHREGLRMELMGVPDQDLIIAQKALDWMIKCILDKKRNAFPLQDIYQYGPIEVRNAKRARHVMRILEEHGYVHSQHIEIKGKRQQQMWILDHMYLQMLAKPANLLILE